MALAAGISPTVPQREGMRPIETRRLPGAGGMAGLTIRPQHAPVVGRFGVAVHALGGRALEDPISMALGAGHFKVRPGEWEGRFAVVEGDLVPGHGRVAQGAVLSKAALVAVVLLVTGVAGDGRVLKDPVDMALLAGHLDVRPNQLKGKLIVIDGDLIPGCRHMASAAVRAKGTLVMVVLLVAGIAYGRSALEDPVNVTLLTSHRGVRPGEGESRFAVVEADLLPIRGHMAGGAVLPEAALVVVVLLVAGETGRWRAFENLIDVAFLTSQRGMGPGQRECGD